MTEGSSNDVPEDIREKEPHARIQLFCEVANIKISQARAQTDKNKRGDLLLEANTIINKARLLDETDQMVHISDAYLSFAQVDHRPSPMPQDLGTAWSANITSDTSCPGTLLSSAR